MSDWIDMDAVPKLPPTSRRTALEHGAALIERELVRLRAQAMHADGHPPGAQYTINPHPEAERIMLATMEFAASAAILREMARQEAS